MEHLMRTINNGSSAKRWESLSICGDLFRKAAKEVGEASGFSYPPYDGKVTPYMEDIRNRYTAAR